MRQRLRGHRLRLHPVLRVNSKEDIGNMQSGTGFPDRNAVVAAINISGGGMRLPVEEPLRANTAAFAQLRTRG